MNSISFGSNSDKLKHHYVSEIAFLVLCVRKCHKREQEKLREDLTSVSKFVKILSAALYRTGKCHAATYSSQKCS